MSANNKQVPAAEEEADQQELQHPRIINGKYELNAKLGSGAFGEVFLGID